jgi:putative ABC transport system permease protein
MPRTRLGRLLSTLLPRSLRRDLFEPAVFDLEAEQLRHGSRPGSFGIVVLFLDCWRLAPAEVFSMFRNDLRHAFRLLFRDPAFTATAVLTLALGVGANVAVFAVVNAVLLHPLPYPDADRLVILKHRDRGTGITKEFIAMGDYVDLHARQEAFESIAAYDPFHTVVHGSDDTIEVSGFSATPELIASLRLQPFAGRNLDANDATPNTPPVVMLGYDLWQKRFGGDPQIVGRSVKMGITPVMRQVIGIAPPGFRFPAGAVTDVIFSKPTPVAPAGSRKNGWVFAAARLKPGVTIEAANAQLNVLAQQMEKEHPSENQGSEYFAVTLRDAWIGDTRPALLLLLGAVGLVLLIACANVANLLVARSLGRRQEMSVRVALGAGRRQIAMQLFAESIALASVAGVAAVACAYWATPALVSLVPTSVNLAAAGDIRLDRTVLLFAAGVTLLTTVTFSLFSGLGLRRDNTAGRLVSPGRVSTGVAVRRATSALVIVEIALAIVLLSGAGLVLRSFSNLLSTDPGFTSAGVLTLSFAVPPDRYRDAGARSSLHQRVYEALGAIPGVEHVGAAAVTPLTGNNWTAPFDRADRPTPAGQRPPEVGWQSASGGYFRALRIPLRDGRYFGPGDGPSAPPVVIISQAVADRFFRGERAVGHKVRLGDDLAEIVGVVGDIRRAALTDAPRADMYFPMDHAPSTASGLFIRTAGDPIAIVPELRAALRSIEPAITLRSIRPMDEIVRESVEVTHLALWLLGLFAATALVLAAIGIYGVMSYAVRQRMREIGTRVALGATPSSILWLVLGQGARVAIAGTLIGLVTALGAGRVLRGLLFSIAPSDPFVLAAAAGLLLATAMVACYVPARRATRVDPVSTLATR